MQRCFGVLIFASLFVTSCKSQNEQSGENVRRLSSFRADLAQQMHKDQIPGIQVTFFSKDKILFNESYGVASNHLIRTNSVSKLFTAVALRQILDARRIPVHTRLFDLSTPFVNWLKSLDLQERENWEQVTLADLMGHTAMLPMEYPEPVDGRWPSHKAIERKLAKVSFVARPGDLKSGAHYCNLGPIILSRLVADLRRAAGLPNSSSDSDPAQDFHAAIREQILKPQGMTDTGYVVAEPAATEPVVPQLAKRHTSVKSHAPGPQIFRNEVPAITDSGGYSGAAGLISSSQELARFFQSLMRVVYGDDLHPPKPELLTRASLMEMLDPRAVVDRQKLFGLGFSWLSLGTESRLVIGHTGGGAGEASMVAFAPDRGLGLALQINAKIPMAALKSYFEKIFSHLERRFQEDAEIDVPADLMGLEFHAQDMMASWTGPAAASVLRRSADDDAIPELIKPILGVYRSQFSDDVEVFWSYGGQIAISHNGEHRMAAVKLADAQFQIVGRSHEDSEFVEFLCDSQNRVMRLRIGRTQYFDSALWNADAGPLRPCQLFAPPSNSDACDDLL